MSPVYCALVHYPVRARDGSDITSAITNLDVHDIARSATTFGLSGFFVVTPVAAQRAILARILEHWSEGPGRERTPERTTALAVCRGADSVDEVLATIRQIHGQSPRVLATAARSIEPHPVVGFAQERRAMAETSVPRLILFGTAHGLADRLIAASHALLPPIVGAGHYNHLSVRAAAAITFDRLLGPQRPEN